MKLYRYELVDGTKGQVFADKYEEEGVEFVFYVENRKVYRIPIGWLYGRIKEGNGKVKDEPENH